MPEPKRILVTGAGRGIGLELTRQWLAAGREVFALARKPQGSEGLAALAHDHPKTLKRAACDVSDDESVAGAAKEVTSAWDRIDLLVNNAGTYGRRGGSLAELDFAEVRSVFEVNTLGPLRVTRAFLPLLRRGTSPRLVHLTSLMGSIADNGSGGTWAYRLSKTALNMASRNLALELRKEGIPSVVLHPGWVRTDMGGPGAPLSVTESAASMIRTIDGIVIEQSGAFLDRDGKPVPW